MVVKSGYNTVNGDYIFSKIANEVCEYQTKTKNQVTDLGIGDVKLPPPESVTLAMQNAVKGFLSENFKGYPPDNGYPFLRDTIANYYKRYGVDVCFDEIFITEGAKNAIGNILDIARFKRALIPVPTYPLYKELCTAHLIKTRLITGSEKNCFLTAPEYKTDCDLIFLCSPCNPTGAHMSEELLQKYVDYALQKNAIIILDGAYSAFCNYFPPQKLKGASKCLIEVRSYSKSLSFTGVRCGYVVISKQNPLYNAYKKRESLRTNGVNYFAQVGAYSAYNKTGESAVNKRIAHYRENASILKAPFLNAGLKVMGGENAPYVFCKVQQNGFDFAKRILNECGVVVTPGEAFNAKGYVRLSCLVTRQTALEGALKIEKFLAK